MSPTSSQSECFGRAAVPDNDNAVAFANDLQEIPLFSFLGAPMFRVGDGCVAANSDTSAAAETETFCTIIDESVLESVFDGTYECQTHAVADNNEPDQAVADHDDNGDRSDTCTPMQAQDFVPSPLVSPVEEPSTFGHKLISPLAEPTMFGSSVASSESGVEDGVAELGVGEAAAVQARLVTISMGNGAGQGAGSRGEGLKTGMRTGGRTGMGGVGKKRKKRKARAPARAWSEEEHARFKESLELFGRNWERCAAYIGTRRAQLVRSHAQKYLIKLWKMGQPLPKKVAESGGGYTLSGKPLHADSASARSYLTKMPCPDVAQE